MYISKVNALSFGRLKRKTRVSSSGCFSSKASRGVYFSKSFTTHVYNYRNLSYACVVTGLRNYTVLQPCTDLIGSLC